MNKTNQLEEAVNLALKLSPKEKIQLIERIASSVEHEMEETAKPNDASGETHWGENLVRLIEEIGPIEFVHPEIEDPTEWVKFMRNEERETARRLGRRQMSGVVDTTVVVHLFRRFSPALAWYTTLKQELLITPMTWLEVLYGSSSKSGLEKAKTILNQFDMEYLTSSDMNWAIQQMEKYRFSKGVTTNDCLIASVAYRLQIPLYTHNVKDMQVLLPTSLVIKPY